MVSSKNIVKQPYEEYKRNDLPPWEKFDHWPCKWIGIKEGSMPFVAAYKRKFNIDKENTITIHVSGDERYELYLDGIRIGRGSERNGGSDWYYETYEVCITKGTHVFVAKVWSLGDLKPWAQNTFGHGFIMAPEGSEYIEMLGTGVALWEVKVLNGYTFESPILSCEAAKLTHKTGAGGKESIDGALFDWGFENGEGEGWQKAQIAASSGTRKMTPGPLPTMYEEKIENVTIRFVELLEDSLTETQVVNMERNRLEQCLLFARMFKGIPVTIPANTALRIIVDLNDYFCLYPELTLSKGKESKLRINWSEALYDKNGDKAGRDSMEGKYFAGLGNSYFPDGGELRKYNTLWWHAGRFMEIIIKTQEEPLIIENINLVQVHYPFVFESSFECEDISLNKLIPMSLRTLEMCSHEILMDCPFYEQKNYIGDTLIESLVGYSWSRDDRLIRKMISIYEPVGEFIPTFRYWWVNIVYDYAMWRGDKAFIGTLMPRVRSIMENAFLYLIDDENLLHLKENIKYEALTYTSSKAQVGLFKSAPGWNYIDLGIKGTVKEWLYGNPPEDESGINCIYNLLILNALRKAAKLEGYFGEFEMEARYLRYADIIKQGIEKYFYNQDTGLFSYYLTGGTYSEHAQILALLCDCFKNEESKIGDALVNCDDLTRTNIFFTHFLFEGYCKIRRGDLVIKRLEPWVKMLENGYKTVPEEFGPNRSDCHAWGSFPAYHYLATILGIRPGTMGFETVTITPSLGDLKHVKGEMVHKNGKIIVEISVTDKGINACINLPEGLEGEFIYKGKSRPIRAGKNNFLNVG